MVGVGRLVRFYAQCGTSGGNLVKPPLAVSQARRRESPRVGPADGTAPTFPRVDQEEEEEENRHRGIVELSEGG